MKKKVLFYSKYDWANSAFKTCQAMHKFSKKYDVKYFAERPHPFMYHRDNVILSVNGNGAYVNHDVVADLYDWHEQADIIHFKGDEGTPSEVHGVKLDLSKPVVLTVCGIGWEQHHDEIWSKYGKHVNQLLATTPDHLQHDIEGLVMPLPINTDDIKPIEKAHTCCIIGFAPTSQRKGGDVVKSVAERLTMRHGDIYFNIQEGMQHDFAMQLKRVNHIFIDQINNLGIYGNNGIEAMALGSVVISSHSYGAEGVVKAMNENELFNKLSYFIENKDELYRWQHVCREWAVNHHSYKVVANKLEKVYDSITNTNKNGLSA
ncbi:MAG: hypothetical protein KAS32_00945 [Candidatus Peribacteraceae bacterium]|nr:hypothetical protein [Candidatus Peribacteraceae bacterium]